jgi:thiol-disulfide isomerase/thioredoxin
MHSNLKNSEKYLRYSFILIVLFTINRAIAQEKSAEGFIISGHISGRDTGIIKLSYTDKNQHYKLDTANVHNGDFYFKGDISEFTVALFSGNTSSHKVDDPNITRLFLEPGHMEIAVADGYFKDAVLKGSHAQDLMNELKKEKLPIEESEIPLNKRFAEIRFLESKQGVLAKFESQIDSIRNELTPLNIQEQVIDLAFIKTHSDEPLSAYILLYISNFPVDSISYYYSILTPRVQNMYFGQLIMTKLMQTKQGQIKQAPLIVGDQAPIFVFTSVAGKPIDLQSFRAKNYILLDFWASWCGACRELNPLLQAINSTYKGKGLVVVSLSADGEAESWKKALYHDKMNLWDNVRASDELINKYGVSSLPTYILVDKDGKIIGRYDTIESDSSKGLLSQLKSIFVN